MQHDKTWLQDASTMQASFLLGIIIVILLLQAIKNIGKGPVNMGYFTEHRDPVFLISSYGTPLA